MAKERPYTRTSANQDLRFQEGHMDLEALSDEELEALLFEDDDSSQTNSALNLPTVAGLSLIAIWMLYLFQHLGMFAGFDITQWVVILPRSEERRVGRGCASR